MLRDVAKIDLVTEDSATGEIRLILVVAADEWKSPKCEELLAGKLDAYASFALDGQLAEQVGRQAKACVVVCTPVVPPDSCVALLSAARERLETENLPVRLEVDGEGGISRVPL